MWTKWDLVGMGRDNACGSNEALSNETIMESKKMIIFFNSYYIGAFSPSKKVSKFTVSRFT